MLAIDAPRSAWNITGRKLTPKVSPSSVSVRARAPEGTPRTTALRSAEVAMRRICAAGCGSVSPLKGDRSDQRIDQ
jgi:hypothetical protein